MILKAVLWEKRRDDIVSLYLTTWREPIDLNYELGDHFDHAFNFRILVE